MKTINHLPFLFISYAGLFFPGATIHANESIHFEAEFKQQRIPLKSNTTLKVDGFGIRYGEVTGLPFRLEIIIGRLAASHKDDPITTGFNSSGYYGGLALAGSRDYKQRMQLGGHLSYIYHSVQQTLNQEKLDLTWRQSEAKIWLGLHMGQRFLLYGCGKYADISGEQHFNGNTISRTDFEADKKLGYCGGLQVAMPDNGFVSLEADGGLQRGGTISFGKRF